MIAKIEAKQKQAQQQVAEWRQRLAQAQEQVIRWEAVMQLCGELLGAPSADTVEEKEPDMDN